MYRLLRPLLFLLPPETAHALAMWLLSKALALPLAGSALRAALGVPDDPALRTRCLGLDLASPVGLAAGFDKDGRHVDALAALGFGFLELGTVTALAQPGNPRPRLFRLPRDRALVNRLGFNNAGAAALAATLAKRPPSIPVGINVGKSRAIEVDAAAADYRASVRAVAPHAAYLVVNVSSPNTPGLRDLQSVSALAPLLAAVLDEARQACPTRPPPVLVKVAPDLADADLDAIAELCLRSGVAGIVATNTTTAREGLRTPRGRVDALGAGGLSGAPLEARAQAVLARLWARTRGRLVLVGVGGIENPDQAWERIRAGASLVQLYTGFIYGGPAIARRIAKGLAARARAAGFPSVAAAVGSAAASALDPHDARCEKIEP